MTDNQIAKRIRDFLVELSALPGKPSVRHLKRAMVLLGDAMHEFELHPRITKQQWHEMEIGRRMLEAADKDVLETFARNRSDEHET